jgi:CDP-diacylglycerol--glycerol-3-phosphate 3-phosphatidyltransferase
MFGPRTQREARRFAERIVRPLTAIGLTPNGATVLGLLLSGATAAVLAAGYLRIGGVLVALAGIFDLFDGALARVQQRKTIFGAFFDSTLDRYSEGLVLLGILFYTLGQPPSAAHTWTAALTYVAALSSLMVSYVKARAEGLGLECKIGFMARPERVFLLSAGLILGGASWVLWTIALLALTSTLTAAQRIVHIWRQLRARPAEAAEAAGAASAPATTDTATLAPNTAYDTPTQRETDPGRFDGRDGRTTDHPSRAERDTGRDIATQHTSGRPRQTGKPAARGIVPPTAR